MNFLLKVTDEYPLPFLAIFMSLVAACSILLGNSKNYNTTKRISFISGTIVAVQAIYIVILNTINFSLANIFIFYIILVLMIIFPLVLIENERKLFKSAKLLKNEYKYRIF